MSPASRLRRYFTPKRELSERELTFFTDIDRIHHEAFAAVDTIDGSIIGVARYVQYRDRRRVADVAVEVADDHQSSGIGTALMSRLVARGRANGLEYFSATTRWDNGPARALARRFGFLARASRGGEIVLELALRPETTGRQLDRDDARAHERGKDSPPARVSLDNAKHQTSYDFSQTMPTHSRRLS